jgi:hypothetical protein
MQISGELPYILIVQSVESLWGYMDECVCTSLL